MTTPVRSKDAATDDRQLPGSREDAAERIWALSRAKAKEALQLEALADRLEGIVRVTGQIERDYAGRFLIELIQNSYDSHPADAEGRIAIFLDPEEGAHGTLYVANTGVPFDLRDVKAISELAQSTKLPDQGIGNKGVGFKSVFLVSDGPEVYSVASQASHGAFDGFCFRFATTEDYVALAGTSEGAAELVRRMGPESLLVPLTDGPLPTVRRFAQEGYNTLVRLPLTAHGAADATSQIQELRESAAPVLLFLDRIAELTIEVVGVGQSPSLKLSRSTKRFRLSSKAETLEVDLGEQGVYLVASRPVDMNRFVEGVRDSVESKRLDPSWLDWREPAVVSVAVRADQDNTSDRLYCYLPMGPDAHSPFQGHVNAPFAVPIARKGLLEDTALNDLLMDEVAALIADVLLDLRRHTAGRRIVTDLGTWRTPEHQRLAEALDRRGMAYADVPFVPVLGPKSWATLRDAVSWPVRNLKVLSPSVVSSVDPNILDPAIGEERLARLDALHQALLRRDLSPPVETLSQWAELIAEAARRRKKFAMQRWLDYYDDLAAIAGDYPHLSNALRGKRILLDDADDLRAALGSSELRGKGRRRTVFLQPGSDGEDEEEVKEGVRLPPALRRRIAFMHPLLRWTVPGATRGARTLRPGRRFLEEEGLVRRWRSSDLFEELTDLLSRDESLAVSRDSLQLVFDIRRRDARTASLSIADIGLRVPSRSGRWIPAADARFSDGWPDTLGSDLEALIAAASGTALEISEMAQDLLPPPNRWPLSGPTDLWRAFLQAAGVKDGLEPTNALEQPIYSKAWNFTPNFIAAKLAMPFSDRRQWSIFAAGSERPTSGSQAQAWVREPVLRIPGQGEFVTMPEEAQQRFGTLVIRGLGQWPKEIEEFALEFRLSVGRFLWPSPAWAFLSTSAWVPIRRTGDRSAVGLVKPSEAWHFSESDDELLPAYAPLLPYAERARVERDEALATRLATLGVRRWGDPRAGTKRIVALADLLAAGAAVESQISAFRKAYASSWRAVVSQSLPIPWDAERPPRLVASSRGQVTFYDVTTDERPLYVLGDEDKLAQRILESRDVLLLEVDPKQGAAVAELLRPALGSRLRLVRRGDLSVLADAASVEAAAAAPLLVTADRMWLSDLLILTLELSSTQFNRQTDRSIHQAVDRLRRIRLRAASSIAILMDAVAIDVPPSLGGVVPLAHEQWPTLVFRGTGEPLDWATLRVLARGIAELVGQPLAGEALRGHIGDLASDLTLEVARPSLRDYAAAFGEDIDRLKAILDGHRGMHSRVLFNLKPVLGYFDPEAPARLEELDSSDGAIHDLAEAVGPFANSLPAELDISAVVQAAQDWDDLDGLRDSLGLDFARFNAVLENLGDPYRPFLHEDEHWAALAEYLSSRANDVYDRLREKHHDAFVNRRDLTAYNRAVLEYEQALGPRARHSDSALRPRQEWLSVVRRPAEAALGSVLRGWLATHGIDETQRAQKLRPVAELRQENGVAVVRFARRSRHIVRAFATKAGQTAPSWTEEEGEELKELLWRQGCLDFALLDEQAVMDWAEANSAWPAGMRSLTLSDLGLTESEVDRAQDAADHERQAKEHQRRAMTLDDHVVSLDPEERLDLMATLERSLTADFLKSPRGPAALAPLEPARKRRDGEGSTKPPSSGLGRLTDEKKELVGFIAEWFAFQWLKHHYSAATSESWVSRNRRLAFSDHEGDDSLGYDFSVPFGRGRRYFEVKAGGDASGLAAVELSDNEVRFAQRHRRGDQYQILFVNHPMNKDDRRLVVLPNPFSEAGAGRYRVAGSGIKYAFRLEGD